MKKLKCLIVEDEPIAAEILEDYIQNVPFLDLAGTCPDALYALEKLQTESIDLVFLDIHLPKLKGLDFLKTLQKRPKVIITTAYHQYAVEGFELEVVDYLLKPVEFSRFLKAVNKIQVSAPTAIASIVDKPYHFFNVNKRKVKVFESDILFIESLKEYVRIFTPKQQLVTKYQIGEIANVLNQKHFLRIHRSYIIALDKVSAFSSTHIEIERHTLPIGRSYKNTVSTILENL
jgi:DNA-binding LytR/AlgR family response regulator